MPTPAGEALKSCEFVLRQSFQASSEQEERRDERGKAEQQWSQLREACKAEENLHLTSVLLFRFWKPTQENPPRSPCSTSELGPVTWGTYGNIL